MDFVISLYFELKLVTRLKVEGRSLTISLRRPRNKVRVMMIMKENDSKDDNKEQKQKKKEEKEEENEDEEGKRGRRQRLTG